MELYNAIIELRPDRLNFPLAPWYAAQLASFHVLMRGVPDDVTGLEIHVGVPGESSHFVVPCVMHADGTWSACAVPGVFPDAGQTQYEVVAFDAGGHETFLGSGVVTIAARESGNVVVATASDENGGTHTLTAIYIDGEWTLRVD